ncbi:MAG: SDR family NAD(P)-dependent oxidoreductase [Planctomycetota bacterium]|nr:MAG: SDR family NAD(P)-dependent oxidoreductase [Planctomycetota bacterium]
MFTERHFLILGATGGIGAEVARILRRAGADVTLVGRDPNRLATLAEELNARQQTADCRSIGEVDKCVGDAADEFGRLDGVVNCVGSILLKPAHLTTSEEWQETLATNLTSAFATVRAGCRAMSKNGGSIVLIASAAATVGLPNHEAIAAAKAGIVGLMRSAAASYAGRGIRVNAVAPGLVQTPLTERIWNRPQSEQTSRSMHPIGRLGTARDVASLIVWLLDPENDWATGQVFGIDGGLSTLRRDARD